MTDDPFVLPAPEKPLERAKAFARDLALGVERGLWPTQFGTYGTIDGILHWSTLSKKGGEALADLSASKYKNKPPTEHLLVSLGYLDPTPNPGGGTGYTLTERTLRLLEKPLTPPKVFISYGRKYSSALGLLLVARLLAVGNEQPFIDMDLNPGDEWEGELEKLVRNSEYFISLVSPGTLQSPIVQKEIRWAMDPPGQFIIPIWHNGYHKRVKNDPMPSDIKSVIDSRNAIRIIEESAEAYNNAIIKVLNRLGYVPR